MRHDDRRGLDASALVGVAPSDAESIEELEEQILELAAHLHAGNHRLLVLIAEFDRKQGWEPVGYRSCAHGLAFHTGVDMGAAREQVRVARARTALAEGLAAERALAAGFEVESETGIGSGAP